MSKEKLGLTLFALKLKRARHNAEYKGRPMTMQNLADVLGVGMTTVSKWERGVVIPTEENIARLAEVLEMDSDEIWLDTLRLPPDMHHFLTTTVEGTVVARNIRKVMNTMAANQKPTTRKGIGDVESTQRTARRINRRKRGDLGAR